jgi:hypothetical protein
VVGRAKVRHVAEALNAVTREVEHVQANLITGLDTDQGELPWELTRELVDLAPAAYPTFFLVTNFYNSPLARELHASGRTLAVPFPLLDTNSHGNVRPLHCSPEDYFERLAGLYAHAFSGRANARRLGGSRGRWGKLANLGHGLDEGRGFIAAHHQTRAQLGSDRELRDFWHGRRRAPPTAYLREVKAQLGPWAAQLPPELASPERRAESFEAAAKAAVEASRDPVAGSLRRSA